MPSIETLEIKNYIGLTGDKPIRFIASDVDGTLVNDAKAIPEDAIEAIRAARESGIRVAIASGRAWNEMNDVIEKLPCLRYFMCTNGAYVMDKDENRSLFHVSFDKEQALHLLRKLLTYGVYVEAYVKDQIFGMYPPSRCITPERLGVCASERAEEDKKTVHGIMDNHLPNTKNQCNGASSLRTNTLAAFSTSPNPPTLLGIIPIICGGTRCAAIMSSRLTFLIFRNSSFAATSDSGMI